MPILAECMSCGLGAEKKVEKKIFKLITLPLQKLFFFLRALLEDLLSKSRGDLGRPTFKSREVNLFRRCINKLDNTIEKGRKPVIIIMKETLPLGS